ncbi:MAG: hypothetical protein AB7G88_08635 [Thermomicrobiales bacterium]
MSDDLIASGRLQWRLAGQDDWRSFGPPVEGESCLVNARGGPMVCLFDIRIRLESTDPAGRFAATLAFEVARLKTKRASRLIIGPRFAESLD